MRAIDLPMRWRPIKYIHTGKFDWDDGCDEKHKHNHSSKRTMRKIKAKRNKLLNHFMCAEV